MLCSLDTHIEFGAEQVILVRDQAEKKRLQKLLKFALVLTIAEAKVDNPVLWTVRQTVGTDTPLCPGP